MPEEEPIEITPKFSELPSESVHMQPSLVVNSREKTLRTKTLLSERQEPFHPVKHNNRLSDADMEAYFKLSDDLDLFHSHERELLQEYCRDKSAEGTLTQDFYYKVNAYDEAWRKFNINLVDKGKSILAVHELLSNISDTQLRENLEKELRSLLESQKMMDFAREKLCRHFHAIQLDELIAQIKDGMYAEEMRSLLDGMARTQQLHTEKLDQCHEFSIEFIIMLKTIEGRLPKGGLEYLLELLEKTPKDVALIYAERFCKVTDTLSSREWEVYRRHRKGESNAKIASELKYSLPHIGKMLKKIDSVFKTNKLPSGITLYVQMKRVYFDDNKKELSSDGSRWNSKNNNDKDGDD